MAGLVGGALSFPMIFLGLPAGALVDRWDRRRVMIVCDAVRCLAVMTVPVAWMLGVLNGWLLLAVAMVLGSAQSFYNICQIAALPRGRHPAPDQRRPGAQLILRGRRDARQPRARRHDRRPRPDRRHRRRAGVLRQRPDVPGLGPGADRDQDAVPGAPLPRGSARHHALDRGRRCTTSTRSTRSAC